LVTDKSYRIFGLLKLTRLKIAIIIKYENICYLYLLTIDVTYQINDLKYYKNENEDKYITSVWNRNPYIVYRIKTMILYITRWKIKKYFVSKKK